MAMPLNANPSGGPFVSTLQVVDLTVLATFPIRFGGVESRRVLFDRGLEGFDERIYNMFRGEKSMESRIHWGCGMARPKQSS